MSCRPPEGVAVGVAVGVGVRVRSESASVTVGVGVGVAAGVTLRSALSRLSLRPVTVLPARAGCGSPVESSAAFSSAVVSDGLLPSRSVAAPATCGEAIEVPSRNTNDGSPAGGWAQMTETSSTLTPSAVAGGVGLQAEAEQ